MSRLPEARRSVNRYVVLLLHFVLVLCLKTKKANTHLAASYRTAHVDSRLVLEKVKPFLILVTFYGSSISWSMCKQSASCCRQDNHASLASLAFYGLDTGPTNIINALKASTEWWGVGMVICLERGADLHMFQLMPLPLTVSCFSKIQIGFFPFWYRLTWVVLEKGPLNGCVWRPQISSHINPVRLESAFKNVSEDDWWCTVRQCVCVCVCVFVVVQ